MPPVLSSIFLTKCQSNCNGIAFHRYLVKKSNCYSSKLLALKRNVLPARLQNGIIQPRSQDVRSMPGSGAFQKSLCSLLMAGGPQTLCAGSTSSFWCFSARRRKYHLFHHNIAIWGMVSYRVCRCLICTLGKEHPFLVPQCAENIQKLILPFTGQHSFHHDIQHNGSSSELASDNIIKFKAWYIYKSRWMRTYCITIIAIQAELRLGGGGGVVGH